MASKGWERSRNLKITNRLALGFNAKMEVETIPGTIVTVNLAELAALDNIAAADLQKIDGITNGAGLASKALVLDASNDITMPGVITFAEPQEYDANTGITAFAGGGVGSAVALTGEFNNITTCATVNDSVKLPAAALGLLITVKNSGAAAASIFPATDDSIDALAADLSVQCPVGATMTFRAISAVVWETQEVFYSSAPSTLSGGFGLKAVDNAADHEVLLANASHGQDTVHSLPDPGGATGTVMLLEGAQTVVGVQTVANPALSAEHGAGAIGTGTQTAPQTRRWTENGVIVTQIKFDVTGLQSMNTANDIIGLVSGAPDAYIGRYVVATDGVVFKTTLACLETPVGGDNDINIVANSSSTLGYNDAGGTSNVVTDIGNSAIGESYENLTPGLTPNDYIYLGAGTGDLDVEYSAGMYVLTLYGHAVLA